MPQFLAAIGDLWSWVALGLIGLLAIAVVVAGFLAVLAPQMPERWFAGRRQGGASSSPSAAPGTFARALPWMVVAVGVIVIPSGLLNPGEDNSGTMIVVGAVLVVAGAAWLLVARSRRR